MADGAPAAPVSLRRALTKLKHAAARALVGAILDRLRHFLDHWRGFDRNGHYRTAMLDRYYGEDARQLASFFEDLGDLRRCVLTLLETIQTTVEPKVIIDNLQRNRALP